MLAVTSVCTDRVFEEEFTLIAVICIPATAKIPNEKIVNATRTSTKVNPKALWVLLEVSGFIPENWWEKIANKLFFILVNFFIFTRGPFMMTGQKMRSPPVPEMSAS